MCIAAPYLQLSCPGWSSDEFFSPLIQTHCSPNLNFYHDTEGEGSLKSRDNARMLGTEKEHILLNAEDP